MSTIIALVVVLSCGCNSLFPGRFEEADNDAKLRELMRAPDPPDLVRDGTVIQGLRPLRIEGVGAVNALPGTGGPPDPSVFRDQLLEEMKLNTKKMSCKMIINASKIHQNILVQL